MKDILLTLVKNEAFMNACITLIAAIASWLIARMFTAKPAWTKYEGILVTAVKTAEKIIPDDTPNTGLARADAALRVFIERYTNAYGKMPTQAIIDTAKLALPIIHDAIEARGTLPASTPKEPQ